ncbi:MAG: PP2C family serine/threonine-protein phosphatase [Patescibacteria group bacterium]
MPVPEEQKITPDTKSESSQDKEPAYVTLKSSDTSKYHGGQPFKNREFSGRVASINHMEGTIQVELGDFPQESAPDKKVEQKEGSESLSVEASHSTVESDRHPDRNEDRVLNRAEDKLFAVFDGAGGMGGGERASSIASEIFVKGAATLDQAKTAGEVKMLMDSLFKNAREAIKAAQKTSPELAKMATTGSVAKIIEQDGKSYAVIGQSGDSRIYRIKGDGSVEQLTSDQSYVNDLVKSGEITSEEAINHPRRNIIVGSVGDGRTPDYSTVELSAGDKLVIVSDGVGDNLGTGEKIADQINLAIKEGKDPAQALVEFARAESRNPNNELAKADDISAVVVNFESAAGKKSEAVQEEGETNKDREPGEKVKAILRLGRTMVPRPAEIVGLAESGPGEGKFYKVKFDMGQGQEPIEAEISEEDILES